MSSKLSSASIQHATLIWSTETPMLFCSPATDSRTSLWTSVRTMMW